MRAALFRTVNRKLVVGKVPDPTPGEGEVVVKVHRCGICGSDLHMAEGHVFSFDDGAVPGHEVSGEIVATGAGVERVKTGDRVSVLPFISCGKCLACLEGDPMGCGQARMLGSFGVTGGYAEYLLTNEIWCVKLPTSVSFRSEENKSELLYLLRLSNPSFSLTEKNNNT